MNGVKHRTKKKKKKRRGMKNNEMMNIIFKTTYKCDNLIFFPLQYLIENITNSQLFFSFYLHERCFGLSCLFPNEHQI